MQYAVYQIFKCRKMILFNLIKYWGDLILFVSNSIDSVYEAEEGFT